MTVLKSLPKPIAKGKPRLDRDKAFLVREHLRRVERIKRLHKAREQ